MKNLKHEISEDLPRFEIVSESMWKSEINRYNDVPYEDLKRPERKTEFSAGYDFFAYKEIVILPHSSTRFMTGIKCYLPKDFFLSLHTRSSLGFQGVTLSECVGVIDSDYYNNDFNEGVIHCSLVNTSDRIVTIKKGSAYMQGIITKYYRVADDRVTTKRIGGLGSTNKSI